MADTDLSKIVSLIMENPKLVEEIRTMVNKTDTDDTKSESESTASVSDLTIEPLPEPIAEESTYVPKRDTRRTELLRALRPYLSEERGKAIESMITIADILTVIREK